MSLAIFLVGATWSNDALLRSWLARQPATVEIAYAILPAYEALEDRIAELEGIITSVRPDAKPWRGDVGSAAFCFTRHGRQAEIVQEEDELYGNGVRVTRVPDGRRRHAR